VSVLDPWLVPLPPPVEDELDGVDPESSIIIMACRRLAPVVTGMEISERGAEGGSIVRPSDEKSGVTGVIYGTARSPFVGGRGLKERCVGLRAAGAGGEGDDGS